MKIKATFVYEYFDTRELSKEIVLYFDDLDELKDQLDMDYSSNDARIMSVRIVFDDRAEILYNFPDIVETFYGVPNEYLLRLSKFEGCSIPDIIHYLEEYANIVF